MLHHNFPQLDGSEVWYTEHGHWDIEPLMIEAKRGKQWLFILCAYVNAKVEMSKGGAWSIHFPGWLIGSGEYPGRPDLHQIVCRCFGDDPIPPGVFLDMFMEAL